MSVSLMVLRRTPSSRSRHIHHGESKVEPSIDEPIIFVQGGVALTFIGWQKCKSKVKNLNKGGSQPTKRLPVDEQNTG